MDEKKGDDEIDYFHPIRMNTLGIPQEHDLLMAYEVYRPALETRKLKSEQGRTLYAEYFIEDIKLGPLRDLCTRTLAKAYTPDQLPFMEDDPLKIRLYYDSLSLDIPMEQCYNITDQKYWRRFVLAKNKDVTLAFKKQHDWRSLGLSMKFVELVEACPAEYWPEDEMQPTAMKIKEHITEMHIRNLQSMSERFFRDRLHLDSDESESDSTDVESFSETPRSTKSSITDAQGTDEKIEEGAEIVPEIYKTEQELEWERMHAEITAERNEQTRIRREAQEKRRAERVQRRREREARLSNIQPEPPVEEPKPGKKKKKFIPKGVLDIVVDEPENDGENLVTDRRNLERILKSIKMLTYPTRLCHHVNLSFLRFFENLVNFTIEFRGPKMERDFHERHLKFSYADMEGLATGLSYLQKLRIFRLRSSQMDARKLYILTKALKCLSSIEIIDFGYDHLDEDCGLGLYEIFRGSKSIKSLELEHNFIGERAMHFLSIAIKYYDGQLEYLGLGGNPLGADGLHQLSNKILGTQHITHLSLRTAQIDESAIICCIANELLKHLPLKYLDVRTVAMGHKAGVEILKVLQFNKSIIHFDARDCNLDNDLELDIDIIVKRNKYLNDNPYLNDPTQSPEEVEAYINRVKNPILLRAMDTVNKTAECLQNRPPEFIPIRLRTYLDHVQFDAERTKSVMSFGQHMKTNDDDDDDEEVDYVDESASGSHSSLRQEPFVYDPNNFTEEEFHNHVYLPGPSERYFYYNLSQKTHISRVP